MASTRDKEKFLLSSLDVYVGGTAAGNLVAYTHPECTFRHPRDIATAEGSVDGKRVPIRRDVIRQHAEFDGSFKQFDVGTLQLILGGTIATGGGYTSLWFGHNSLLPSETQWSFKGQTVDGKEMWLIFPKGQCLTPVEIPMGGEEHANVPFTIGANYDPSGASGEQTIYRWVTED